MTPEIMLNSRRMLLVELETEFKHIDNICLGREHYMYWKKGMLRDFINRCQQEISELEQNMINKSKELYD